MDVRIKVCIDAWDDPEFRTAFDRAYQRVVVEDLGVDTPEAAGRAQHLLVEAGYPDAKVVLERSVDEALAHAAHWTVYRSSPAPAATR